jgi:4-hydroxy-tetrahydrodipicolinate synthase
MGNVHPELYAWLCRNWDEEPARAERLQNFLGVASMLGARAYPVSAKYYLQLEGLPLSLHTRTRPAADLTSSIRLEVAQLRALTQEYVTEYL